MALPHRQELLELALDSFALRKNERMHELLVQVIIVYLWGCGWVWAGGRGWFVGVGGGWVGAWWGGMGSVP